MNRPKYLFLVCPDPQLIKSHIDERLGTSGQQGWETKTFWGDDDDPLPATFWTDLTIKSLFPQPKHSLSAVPMRSRPSSGTNSTPGQRAVQ